jgi:hypothetical protein
MKSMPIWNRVGLRRPPAALYLFAAACLGATCVQGGSPELPALPFDPARLPALPGPVGSLEDLPEGVQTGARPTHTVPGCSSQRNLHAHHVLFRSAGGGDDLANLTTLCAAHHQRCVHAGVIRISGRAPDRLVFEMPLGRFRSGDSRCYPSSAIA